MSDEEKVFEEIDKTKDKPEDISQKAEEIAAAKVSELQEKITSALGDKKKGYADFDEMQADIDRRAEEKAEAKVKELEDRLEKKREAEREAEKAETETKAKQTVEEQKKEWERMSEEWKEAVADGLAPAIKPELAKRLAEGAKFEDLTEEERNDEGLVFYREAQKRHIELRKEGKATSFYRTIQKGINPKPAGATAPVFGGAVAATPDEDFLYDDLHAETREKLGVV